MFFFQCFVFFTMAAGYVYPENSTPTMLMSDYPQNFVNQYPHPPSNRYEPTFFTNNDAQQINSTKIYSQISIRLDNFESNLRNQLQRIESAVMLLPVLHKMMSEIYRVHEMEKKSLMHNSPSNIQRLSTYPNQPLTSTTIPDQHVSPTLTRPLSPNFNNNTNNCDQGRETSCTPYITNPNIKPPDINISNSVHCKRESTQINDTNVILKLGVHPEARKNTNPSSKTNVNQTCTQHVSKGSVFKKKYVHHRDQRRVVQEAIRNKTRPQSTITHMPIPVTKPLNTTLHVDLDVKNKSKNQSNSTNLESDNTSVNISKKKSSKKIQSEIEGRKACEQF